MQGGLALANPGPRDQGVDMGRTEPAVLHGGWGWVCGLCLVLWFLAPSAKAAVRPTANGSPASEARVNPCAAGRGRRGCLRRASAKRIKRRVLSTALKG